MSMEPIQLPGVDDGVIVFTEKVFKEDKIHYTQHQIKDNYTKLAPVLLTYLYDVLPGHLYHAFMRVCYEEYIGNEVSDKDIEKIYEDIQKLSLAEFKKQKHQAQTASDQVYDAGVHKMKEVKIT